MPFSFFVNTHSIIWYDDIMMIPILRSAAIVGASTLASAFALQKLYQVTGIYPPEPVFWFFSGFTAYAVIEAVEHLTGKEVLEIGHQLP